MSAQSSSVEFVVDGLTYRGLSWGSSSLPTVIAIHGWLDNALSFAKLAPLLTGYRVIALDLSGHGLSSHRSPDSSYHIWDDVPQLVGIVDQLELETVHVVGHSRGAGIAGVLAVALGERCATVTMLDGMISRSFENDDGAELFRSSLSEKYKYTSRAARIFNTVEDFITARTRYGFTRENAETLIPRALRQLDEGWLLLSDPRLFGGSYVKLSEATTNSFYQSLQCPVLVVLGEDGFFASADAKRRVDEIAQYAAQFSRLMVPGPHHFHLEGDVVALGEILKAHLSSGVAR